VNTVNAPLEYGTAVVAVVVVVLVVVANARNGPQDTRPPALLCAMNTLSNTSVLSVLTENTKSAQPLTLVLLYRMLVHGSVPPTVKRWPPCPDELLQSVPLCTCTPQPFVAVQSVPPLVVSNKLASKPLIQPAPTIVDAVVRIVTAPVAWLLPNGVRLALITSMDRDKIPHATRPPALLCTMKGLPSIAVELVVTKKVNEAVPVASVSLYRTVAHGSGAVPK
jgi:hypothetical protein